MKRHRLPSILLATLISAIGLGAVAAVGTVLLAAQPEARFIQWQETPLEIAAGRGIRGPWQQNESRFFFVDDPTIAMNDRGEAAVAWVDQASKNVFFQRFSANGEPQLDQGVDVSGSPDIFSWLPRVAIAPDSPETIYIIWQEIIFSGGSHGGDVLFARSDDNGASFSRPVNLSDSIGGAGKGRIRQDFWENGSFDLAVGPGGALYVVWTEFEGSLWLRRSSDGGATFMPKQKLGAPSDVAPARGPSLALGPNSTLYLAWTIGEDAAADIRLATSADAGESFGDLQTVATSSAYSDAPKLAVDAAGTLHLAYAEGSGGPFSKFQIHYKRSPDGGRTFDIAQSISSPLPESVVSSRYPHLALDRQGNPYVLWETFPDHQDRPRGLALAVSQDKGQHFSAPALVPHSQDPLGGPNGSQQGLLMSKLAVSGDGDIAIVNSSLKQSTRSRVWLMRGSVVER